MAVQAPETPTRNLGHERPVPDLVLERRPSDLPLKNDGVIRPIPLRRNLQDLIRKAYDYPRAGAEQMDGLLEAEYGGDDAEVREFFLYRGKELVGSLVVNVWEMGTPEGKKYWEYFTDDLQDVKVDHKDPGFVRRAKIAGRTRAMEIRGLAVMPDHRDTGVEGALLQEALAKYPSAEIYTLVREPQMMEVLIRELAHTPDQPQIYLGKHSIVTPGLEKEFAAGIIDEGVPRLQMEAFLRVKALTRASASLVYLNPSHAHKTSLVNVSRRLTPPPLVSHLENINAEQKNIGWSTSSVATYLTATPKAMRLFSQAAAA